MLGGARAAASTDVAYLSPTRRAHNEPAPGKGACCRAGVSMQGSIWPRRAHHCNLHGPRAHQRGPSPPGMASVAQAVYGSAGLRRGCSRSQPGSSSRAYSRRELESACGIGSEGGGSLLAREMVASRPPRHTGCGELWVRPARKARIQPVPRPRAPKEIGGATVSIMRASSGFTMGQVVPARSPWPQKWG